MAALGDVHPNLFAPPRTTLSPVARRMHALLALLPKGRPLSDVRWEARHRGMAIVLWLHVPALFVIGLATRHAVVHSLTDVVPVAACGVLAFAPGRTRHFRSTAVTLGLVLCSAMLVHLTGGNVEMHFHFFVVVGVITLYQDWVPFGLCLVFVVLHHGVVGVLNPDAVYNHPAARHNPWLWAGIHGAFVLAASVAQVLAWRLNEEQALLDGLTRLPNRDLLSDRVRLALSRRARDGRDVTVLFVDLDGFKAVNDTMGHAAGDELLVEVAQRIRGIVRATDTAARLGGDEFAVLLDGHDRHAAVSVAERILESLCQPVRVDGHERLIGASIGVVAVTHETSVDQVLRNADLAMYMAKAAGRGRVEVFEDAMFDDAIDRADLERDLRTAIADGQISVSYQPSVDLATGAVHGVEALVRWAHPERGNVPPVSFIPVAESTGLILDLGRQVLRTACRDAVRLRLSEANLTVAVNVSARQLVNAAFVGEVAEALRDSGLDGSALVIEITESMLVHDVDQTVARLGEIKALGVRVAIDDFGTGYSSLSYLRHFPIDILKIDRSFVEQLPGDGAALARSIVRLGQSLHLDVVAEGVEDDAQRVELRRLGCANAQGFLFAKAQPVDEVERLIRHAHERGDWWRPDVAGMLPAQRRAVRRPAGAPRTVSRARQSSV
jgi:diguanylate cyclase (GGDEF)-like protein